MPRASSKRRLRNALSRLSGGRLAIYSPRTEGVYELETEQPMRKGQGIYDPAVFGRYELATQRVVPLETRDGGIFELDFDTMIGDAQRFVAEHPTLPPLDRYGLALPALAAGSGVCLDACTASPEPWVRERVNELGFEYIAIDIDGDGGAVKEEDVRSLSFADASVARIVSLDTLEHVEGYERALAEFFRVLEPGGMAVMHVPAYFVDREKSVPIRAGVDPWDHVRYFSARNFLVDIEAAGFLILRVGLHLDYGAVLVAAGRP